MKRILFAALLLTASPLQAAGVGDVAKTYADIAHAGYEDSLITARRLQAAVAALVSAPNADTLAQARGAWLAARVPYQQTEAYRFANKLVDDWEGKVNAWPLDEGLIDYTAAAYGTASDENTLYAANVIANPMLKINGKTLDATVIDKKLLSSTLHEAGGVESNVATGYHAIEFLLWGQDMNGTGPGAGNRPASDFDTAKCTGGNCPRRVAYLMAASELLVDDLAEMTAMWAPGGAARKAVMDAGVGALATIITGMGSLSYGELAGERMKLGLILHDPEEEHDCFSDNTHHSHYYDAKGIRNVYLGRYKRVDGRVVEGASLAKMVDANAPDVGKLMRASLDKTMAAMSEIVRTAEDGEAYDQMIAKGNTAGNAKVQAAIDALAAQTRVIERVVAALGLKKIAFEGSDSLDNPAKVGK